MKILLLLLFLTIILPLFAENRVIETELLSVHPTQMEIGEERINEKIDEYYKKWQKKYPNSEKSFEQYVASELVPKKKFPAVIGPDGVIYILDGHHRTTTFTRILKDHPSLLKSASYKVEIIADYSHETLKRFAVRLIEVMGKGYFPREIRNKNLSAEKLLELLPNSVEGLEDSPMRSLIGKIFDDVELETDYMKDYIQFYIGEFVEDLEIEIDYENLLSDENVERVKKAMFKSSDIVEYMLASPRSEETKALNEQQVINVINEVINKKERKGCASSLRLLFR